MYLRPRLVFLMVLAVLLATLGANSVSLAAPTTLATTLSVTPQNAIPNQRVTLLGSGFTPVATSGGAGPSGAHQITGSEGSLISVGQTILVSPNVTYPINFDANGNWTALIILPVTAEVVLEARSLSESWMVRVSCGRPRSPSRPPASAWTRHPVERILPLLSPATTFRLPTRLRVWAAK